QQPVAWTTYVSTDAADGVAEKVKANGGQVVAEPMDVMELGRMTVFLDPQGVALGAWQPIQFPGAGIVNDPAALGWTADEQDFLGMKYTLWKVGDEMVAGGMPMGDEFPAEVPSYWAVY